MDLATLRDFFPTIINQVCNVAAISRTVGTASLKFLIFAFHTLIEAGLESVIEQYVRLRFLSSAYRSSANSNTTCNIVVTDSNGQSGDNNANKISKFENFIQSVFIHNEIHKKKSFFFTGKVHTP